MSSVLDYKEITRRALEVREGLVKAASWARGHSIWYDARDLAGACGYASLILCRLYPVLDIVVGEFYERDDFKDKLYPLSHCWVETETHFLDITATQFAGATKPLYCLPKTGNFYKKHYNKLLVGVPALDDLSKWYTPKWEDMTFTFIREFLK